MTAENIDEKIKEAELEKKNYEVQKLQAEIENLKSTEKLRNKIIQLVPVITAIVAIITSILAVLGFWINVRNFNVEQDRKTSEQAAALEKLQKEFDDKIKLSEKEFRRNFYEEQMKVYLDLSETVSKIYLTDDKNKIAELHRHFLELYHGKLIIIEQTNVKNAADNFEEFFNKYEKHLINKEELKTPAEKLSEACRDTFKDIWGVPKLGN